MEDLNNLKRIRDSLWTGTQPVEESWARLLEAIQKEVAIIKETEARGESVVPQIPYEDIVNGKVTEEQKREIKKRGCAIIKGTVPDETVAKWNDETVEYLANNDFLNSKGNKDDAKNFFSGNTPQIYGVYWSRPQVEARQHPNMAKATQFLNNLWVPEEGDPDTTEPLNFNPNINLSYADRLRMRTPGNEGGLPPHIDGGSIERWVDPAYQKVYKHVFSGEWEKHNPFHGILRVHVEEFPSPNVCTFFRSYQGWLALSAQGPGDGTLQVVPLVKEAISFILLRPFLGASEEDPLCGALFGKQHRFTEKWHAALLEGLVTIPKVERGDTVWWHPDLVHAVERKHNGQQNSSVFYIPAGPLCVKNANYLVKQRVHFLQGKAGPDFPQEDIECHYINRGSVEQLTSVGRAALGFGGYDLDGYETPEQLKVLRDCAAVIYGEEGNKN